MVKTDIRIFSYTYNCVYFSSNLVATLLPKSNLYVYYDNNKHIVGFLGEMDSYIAGLFVKKEFQTLGIGTQLINHVKELKNSLTLHVYKKNSKALKVYLKNNFVIDAETFDNETDEIEFSMTWKK
ncbi:GNAT family N-acetyltransferase [Leuconostoc kimchii]|uniref:GNAT family N-acetyltransferase n=1 Tax=Leuconostoc kimchii TaxID=136609 RepID=A0ABX5SLX1_9LACO|nr:GNAT family N-acetyltransferase [Leuconostoc kimchii]